MPEVKYYKWPNARKRPMSPTVAFLDEEISNVRAALSVNLIRENKFEMIVMANNREYETVYNYGPAMPFRSDGNVKTWWNSGVGFESVMPAQTEDGSYLTDQNADSVEGLQWISPELQKFYKEYFKHFARVPKLILKKFSDEEAGRSQFGNGPTVGFPLAKILRNDPVSNLKSTFPPGIGLKINEDDGELYWFKLAEYRAAFPIETLISIPPAVEVPAGKTLLTIEMIMGNPATTAESKVAAIKALFIKPQVITPANAI